MTPRHTLLKVYFYGWPLPVIQARNHASAFPQRGSQHEKQCFYSWDNLHWQWCLKHGDEMDGCSWRSLRRDGISLLMASTGRKQRAFLCCCFVFCCSAEISCSCFASLPLFPLCFHLHPSPVWSCCNYSMTAPFHSNEPTPASFSLVLSISNPEYL